MENKIPKIIHYCWFGRNPLPPFAKKCIASWKKYCPDYQIIEWNEDNFDIGCNDYVREAYEAKKWAFVSDVARLHALVSMGGIYMDTDVEVLRPIDRLLKYEAVLGFESRTEVSSAFMAACEGHTVFKELLKEYDSIHFTNASGEMDITPNIQRITSICRKNGLLFNNKKQTVKNITILPVDYLSPKDNSKAVTTITANTLVIHHFDGSWLPKENKYWLKLFQEYNQRFPKPISHILASYVSYNVRFGATEGHRRIIRRIFTRIKSIHLLSGR